MPKQLEGANVARMVTLLVALTAVVPPSAAYALARWRVARAQSLADAAVTHLAARRADLVAPDGGLHVTCGPGRRPRASDTGSSWLRETVRASDALSAIWPQDPWGRCYLLNVRGVHEGSGGLLISAGPNGTIDTPLSALAPSGDDIAALVR
jgi:hypothetical protein